MHRDAFKQDMYSPMGEDGGCRVGEVRAGTASPHPRPKGLSATVTVRDPPTTFLNEFSEI